MYSAGEAEEKTEAPAVEIINAPTKEDETEITGLMYDGTEVPEEPEENEAQENDDNDANIYGLMKARLAWQDIRTSASFRAKQPR